MKISIALAACLLFAAVSPVPGEAQVFDPVDPVINGQAGSVAITIEAHAPSHVLVGQDFQVGVTVTLNDFGFTIIGVKQAPENALQPCTVTGVSYTGGGLELANDVWLLANYPSMADPMGEVAERSIPNALNIGYTVTASQSAARCEIGSAVTNYGAVLGGVTPPEDVVQAVTEVQELTVPLAMGHIETFGSMVDSDTSQVLMVATPVFLYMVLSDSPKIQLNGMFSHSEGNSYKDYGRYRFDRDGDNFDTAYATASDDVTARPWGWVDDLPFEEDSTITVVYCFKGWYVDSGEYRGDARTCSEVMVTEPSTEAIEVLLPAICEELRLPLGKLQILQGRTTIYQIGTTPEFLGMGLAIDSAKWLPFCEET